MTPHGPESPPGSGGDALRSLAAVAARVAGSLRFATVAINLYRPAWDDFEVVVVHGGEAARSALLGSTLSHDEWLPLFAERFRRGDAYFVPHGEFDWEADVGHSYVPALRPTGAPGEWHAEDALFVPLRSSDGRLLGVLSVDEPESGRRPDADELEVLAAVTAQASLAAEAAQHAAAASRHRSAVEHLLRVSSRLTGQDAVDAILADVCAGIRDALGFRRVTMWLEQPDGLWAAGAGAGWTADEQAALPRFPSQALERVLVPELQQEGCVLLEPEPARALTDPIVHAYASRTNGRGPHAWRDHWLLVPLHDRTGRLVGAIWVDDPDDHLRPSAERLQALRAFANQAMSAMEAARALERERHLAGHDPLTGLRNRRGLHAAIDAAVTREGERGVALLVCDLDTFKRINDVLGYETGDAVLRTVGATLRAACPAGGLAARLGGEEFALLLPGLGEEEALAAAERVRRAVAAAVDAVPWGLTVSVGVAVDGPGLEDAEALLRAGARALVAAKRLGRDRAVAYREQALAAALGTLEERTEHREQLAAMLALAETLDLRDQGTARHSITVGAYAEAIARELGFDRAGVERMRVAGVLHDLGKLGVTDAILHKQGPLDDREWEEMRRHPELGARILDHAGLRDVAEWVRCHHERLDGRGYPRALDAEAIPLQARILSAADAYEAMTAARPYRPDPMAPAAALAELRRHAGTQFCPDVVTAFARVLARGRASAPEVAPGAGR